MDYKQIRFKADVLDEKQGIFEGYASVFGNLDSGEDIVDPGAFARTLEENFDRIKILALHNDQLLPVGKPLELREDDKGLYIKARISDTSLGKDVKVLLKDGVLNELSIGYDTVKATYDDDGNRHLVEVTLWEVSVVTWAMNGKATIDGYKSRRNSLELLSGWLDDVAGEQKEGRKISAARLKTLQEASTALKNAVKTIDAIIKESAQTPPKGKPPGDHPEEKMIELIL